GTGNSSANSLTGNGAANTLDGQQGVDSMTGGQGDDTYVVDTLQLSGVWGSGNGLQNFQDIVTEQTGEGYDSIVANNIYSATLPGNVEKMTVVGVYAASQSFTLADDVRRKFTGNALDNVIDASLAGSVGLGVGVTFVGSGAGGEIVIDGG